MTQLAIRHEEHELLIPDDDVSDPQLSIVVTPLVLNIPRLAITARA